MVTQGLLIRMEAREHREHQAERFLKSVLPLARQEPGTTAWFALHFGRDEYGVIDFFPDEAAREAHLNGAAAAMLFAEGGPLFAEVPTIQRLEVLADKVPVVATNEYSTKALMLTFRARAGHEPQVEQFLRNAQALAENEENTVTWFAFRTGDGEYGIFGTFGAAPGRFDNLTGHIARELAVHARTLLGGVPDIDLIDILAEKVFA
ncbi:putative quinol monooxygenase [Massilia cavernae]|uniref:Antibiotic biosynthesis monooxygenase n=1 Tax=Massilia cavernae TaxID=2320864 RepID=A0A418XGP8_9BURK|nr:hypothetical protein [Massilia cavernae]RJG11644.1 hypothetical protein D3872_18525 [Massilia cavernae]